MSAGEYGETERCLEQTQTPHSETQTDGDEQRVSLMGRSQAVNMDPPRTSQASRSQLPTACKAPMRGHHNHVCVRSPDGRASFPPSPTRKCSHQHSPTSPTVPTLPSEETLHRYMLTIVIVVVLCVLVIVSVIVVAVIFSAEESESSDAEDLFAKFDERFIVPLNIDHIIGDISIIGGPLGAHNSSLTNKQSSYYSFVSRSFEYQVKAAFQRSFYSDIFAFCKVTSFRAGSVIVEFQIHFSPFLTIDPFTFATMSEVILNSTIGNSFGVFDINTTNIAFNVPHFVDDLLSSNNIEEMHKCVIERRQEHCRTIDDEFCLEILPYNLTVAAEERDERLSGMLVVNRRALHLYTRSMCHQFASQFTCALFNPSCQEDAVQLPCQEFCLDVVSSCSHLRDLVAESVGSCDGLPRLSTPRRCYMPESFGVLQCERNDINMCTSMGLPEPVQIQYPMERFFDVLEMSQTFGCYRNIELFGCAFLRPPCMTGDPSINGEPTKTKPMCKELCVEAFDKCGFFFELVGADWTQDIDCDAFPSSNESDICIGWDIPSQLACGAGYIECDEGRCVPKQWRCDGKDDCRDGTDELHCARCEEGYFLCSDHRCIPDYRRCDGVTDCSDGQDEQCVRISEDRVMEVYNVTGGTWWPACTDWHKSSELEAALTGHLSKVDHSFERGQISNRPGRNCPASTAYVGSFDFSGCANVLPEYLTSFSTHSSREVESRDWPWIVSLHGGADQTYFCAGAIISERWVLTAGHCVHKKTSVDGWTIIAGHGRRRSYNPHRQVRSVSRIIQHDNFTSAADGNDVALIELAEEFVLNEFVRAVCLPSPGYTVTPGDGCLLGGWGKVFSTDVGYSEIMKLRKLIVVSASTCYSKLQEATKFTLTRQSVTDNICAIGLPTTDACNGDSGGPLLCPAPNDTWVMAGIVSWGITCGDIDVPGVNTNVVRYLPWINATLSHF